MMWAHLLGGLAGLICLAWLVIRRATRLRRRPPQHEQATVRDVLSAGAQLPSLRIVIMVAGTRGDVQPAVALALRLQCMGHLVRVATHRQYQDFVVQAGVRHFHPLGGDPVALTKVTVASRGILPCSLQAFAVIRNQYKELMYSLLPAATHPFTTTDPQHCKPSLIITTPITYGAAHVAEALQVPLHVISAVPWAPSKELPHPWARAWDMSWSDLAARSLAWVLPPVHTRPTPAQTNCDTEAPPHSSLAHAYMHVRDKLCAQAAGLTAWLSTILLDHVVWFGIADLLMVLRVRQLNLWPWGSSQSGWCLYKCPTVFTFSPTLVSCPHDWPAHMIVSGQLQLAQATDAPQPTTTATTATSSSSNTHRRLTPAASLQLCKTLSLTDEDAPDFAACGLEDEDVCGTDIVDWLMDEPQPQRLQDLSPAGCTAGTCSTEQGQRHAGPLQHASLLPSDLLDFLSRGSPPVYIGFGSAAVHDTPDLLLTICQAAVNTHTRLLINRSMWVGVGGGVEAVAAQLRCSRDDKHVGHVTALHLNELVHVVDELPHDLLLPRCNAVVHHGGAGTVHAGLMAGAPTLVTPCYGDNFFWASVVSRLGAGPPPLPAHTLTAANLGKAFLELRQPKYKAAAQAAARQLRTERGLDVAVQHIFRHLPAEVLLSPQHTDDGMCSSRKSEDKQHGDSQAALSKLASQARLKLCRFWYA